MVFQEVYGKMYSLIAYQSNNFQIVFILLVEVIAFHVYISIVEVEIRELKRLLAPISLILRAYWLVSSLLNIGFNKLSK